MATRRLLVEVVGDDSQLQRTFTRSSAATAQFGRNAKAADRELSRTVRGALAGTGVFRGLGRSIAFASGGFLAFASAGQFIRSSVDAARDAAVTQRQLQAQLRVTGQSWATYRGVIERTLQSQSALSGFTADDLEKSLTTITRGTNDVTKALKLNALAADIARGRHTSLAQASIAVGKAAAGSTTALRRLGIELPKGATGAQGLALAAQKFAGQAQAGASAADRFAAVLHNTEVIIGTALLPTLNKYLGELGRWLQKMNETGRLQREVKTVVGDTIGVFRTIGGVIKGVDKVTGSFENTLKLLIALKLAAAIRGWIGPLETLASRFGLVADAEAAAFGGGALRGGSAAALAASTARKEVPTGVSGPGGLLPFLFGANAARLLRGGGTDPKIISRIEQYTKGVASTGTEATKAGGKIALLSRGLRGLGGTLIALAVLPKELDALGKVVHSLAHPQFGGLARPNNQLGSFVTQNAEIGVSRQGRLLLADQTQFNTNQLKDIAKHFGLSLRELEVGVKPTPELAKRLGVSLAELDAGIQSVLSSVAVITPQLRNFVRNRNIVPQPFQIPGPGFQPQPPQVAPLPKVQHRFFDFGKPLTQYFKQFQLNLSEQLAQANAALTRSNADDVAAAREVVARIKRLIDQGRLHGAALIQALGLEASALSTIWSAEDAAAQKRAADAQAAKQRIEQQIQNAIDPLKLEVALSRAQAFGKPVLPRLRALLRAAEDGLRKAIAAHNLDLEKQALDQITSLKQQIKDAQTQSTVTFTEPLKLQLALARDQALGLDQTKDLERLKAAILKFIATHRKNTAALIDAYNQLAQVNQQLGSTAKSLLGGFKQLNTRRIVKGLPSLSPADAAKLRAELSQIGPGGTVPGQGVGAAGFIIGPDGRPLGVKSASSDAAVRAATRLAPSQFQGVRFDRFLNRLEKIADRPIHITLALDGKRVTDVVTRQQQKHRRRNPSQRRGPNAGFAGA